MSRTLLFLTLVMSTLVACETAPNVDTSLNEALIQSGQNLTGGPLPDGQPGGPPPGGPNLSEAAQTLGVSETDLRDAMRREPDTEPGTGPDYAAIATKLGVTEEALRAAVPPPPARPEGEPPGGGGPPPPGGQRRSR